MSMPRWKQVLCRFILKLDRIPRYGRGYTLTKDTVYTPDGHIADNPTWKYQKYGLWGFYFLDDIGWLHEFMDLTKGRHVPGCKVYQIYKSPNWREDFKWRRRLGVWPKVARRKYRISRTRRDIPA